MRREVLHLGLRGRVAEAAAEGAMPLGLSAVVAMPPLNCSVGVVFRGLPQPHLLGDVGRTFL